MQSVYIEVLVKEKKIVKVNIVLVEVFATINSPCVM